MKYKLEKCADFVCHARFRRHSGLLTIAALFVVATQSYPLGANTTDTAEASDEFLFESSIVGNSFQDESLDPIERAKAALEQGDPNDFWLRRGLATAYQQKGMYEEALEQLLWCLDESAKHEINQSISPLGPWVLPDIKDLARVHSPAMDALTERRDSLFDDILGNEPEYQSNRRQLDIVFAALVFTLDDDDYTLSVLRQLEDDQTADRTETLEILATASLDTLDQHSMFDLIVKYVNVRRQVDVSVLAYSRQEDRHRDDTMRSLVQGKLLTLYKSLLATNQSEDAHYAVEQIVGLFDDAQIYNALALAAMESNNPSEGNVLQARKAVELDPSNAKYVSTLIQLLHTTGSNTEAVETGRKFLSTDPSARDAAVIENTLERIQ